MSDPTDDPLPTYNPITWFLLWSTFSVAVGLAILAVSSVPGTADLPATTSTTVETVAVVPSGPELQARSPMPELLGTTLDGADRTLGPADGPAILIVIPACCGSTPLRTPQQPPELVALYAISGTGTALDGVEPSQTFTDRGGRLIGELGAPDDRPSIWGIGHDGILRWGITDLNSDINWDDLGAQLLEPNTPTRP